MLQGLEGHHNTSSNPLSNIAARLNALSTGKKILIGSALLLALFLTITAALSTRTNNNEIPDPSSQFTSNASVNLEGLTNDLLPEADQGQSKVEASVDVRTSTKEDGNTVGPQVQLEVNGQEIAVPENGQVTETVTGSEDEATVRVNVQSQTTETDDRDTSRIRIDSESESEVRIRSSF